MGDAYFVELFLAWTFEIDYNETHYPMELLPPLFLLT